MKTLLTLFVLFFSSSVVAEEFKFDDLTVDEINDILEDFFTGNKFLKDEQVEDLIKNNKLNRIFSDTKIESVKENTSILVQYDYYWNEEISDFSPRPFIRKILTFNKDGFIEYEERTSDGEDDWDFRTYRENKDSKSTITAYKNEEKWSVINLSHFGNIIVNQSSMGNGVSLYDEDGKIISLNGGSFIAKYERTGIYEKIIIQTASVKYEEAYFYLEKYGDNWIYQQKYVSAFQTSDSNDEFIYSEPKEKNYRKLLSYDDELLNGKLHADLTVKERKKIKNYIHKNIKVSGSGELEKNTAIVYLITFDENGDIVNVADLYVPNKNENIIQKTINQITKLGEVGINNNKLKNKFIVFPVHYNLL